MKMHHLDKEKVVAVMGVVKEVIASGEYPPDKIEEIFQAIGSGSGKIFGMQGPSATK